MPRDVDSDADLRQRLARTCPGCGQRSIGDDGLCSRCGARKTPPPKRDSPVQTCAFAAQPLTEVSRVVGIRALTRIAEPNRSALSPRGGLTDAP